MGRNYVLPVIESYKGQGKSQMKCLIVGCGRSGTGFLASLLNNEGLDCGHERIFHPKTDAENGFEFEFESSWLAAPYIDEIQDLTHLIHVVREPRLVTDSFIRLGVFAPTPIHHFTKGYPIKFLKTSVKGPLKSYSRWCYVMAMRKFLKNHSKAFEASSEPRRAEVYWEEWNEMIESKAKNNAARYFLLRLGDVSEKPELFFDCLGLKCQVSGSGLSKERSINKKSGYRPRTSKYELNESTIRKASEYGLVHGT